jgi:hypothetical protein
MFTWMSRMFLDAYKNKRVSIESDEVDSYLNDGTGELTIKLPRSILNHQENLPVTIFLSYGIIRRGERG